MMLHDVGNWLTYIFGGDFPPDPLLLHQAAARGVLIYLIGLVIVRIGKSRLIGRITALDVILGFILGSLLSRGMTGHASISGTSAACAAIVAAHWLLTLLACHWHGFGTLLKGNAYVIVEDGKALRKNMSRSHISEHDLEEELRLGGLSGMDALDQVQCAYKERNGQLSILKKRKPPRVLEVAVQGGVQTIRLEVQSG
jgi:uncharacterized membrane protein YcaP (DUF421 family)